MCMEDISSDEDAEDAVVEWSSPCLANRDIFACGCVWFT